MPRAHSGFESRNVRCIDFERDLATLPEELQLILIYRYRDGYTGPDLQRLTGLDRATTQYRLYAARRALAIVLDRHSNL